jgi:hypothetical protein
MYSLINKFDEVVNKFHIYNLLEKIIEDTDSKFFDIHELINKQNLEDYLISTYGSLPKFIISFYGIGTLSPIAENICKLKIKIIIISDDIHHAKRLSYPRIPCFNLSYVNFNTYGYQLNRWNLPNLSNNYFFPHSARWIIDFNTNPINKVLISGSISDIYPDRLYLSKLNNNNLEILKKNKDNNIWGENYYKYLNKYVCCFVDTPRDYILAKVFETCASGSLLLCMNKQLKKIFEQMGFIDYINYISCTREDVEDKINYITDPDNKLTIDIIRKKGQELIKEKHHYLHRYNYLKNIIEDKYVDEIKINNEYKTTYRLGFEY